MAESAQQEFERKKRDARCYVLRTQEKSYAQIAHEVGFTHGSAARKAVRRFLDQVGVEDARSAAVLAHARYSDLLVAHWANAVAGDTAALQRVLKIMDAMSALYGFHR